MSDRDDMESFLEAKPVTVQRGVEVITPEDLPVPLLFHISKNTNIKEFIPQIGHRQGKTEDRTVPRVCVAPTLLGCMIGYAAVEFDFYDGERDNKNDAWLGGYKIYGFGFKHALRAKKKVVYDAAMSDECWLVSYNADTVKYKPVDIGRVFLSEIKATGRMEGTGFPDEEIVCYAEIKMDPGIPFSKNTTLTKGYWRITGPAPRRTSDWKQEKKFTVVAISKDEYIQKKELTAGLLNIDAPRIPW